ncbi:uncharacterized protein PFL1_03584 [Pseudozyma flocculosa PF-1]|uniref:Uncharacterized protein n=2 Tax=Pseudozyma flocculosa TaxID=84751 RepID=A0A5C3F4I9_9BASI|nr:uncharacterized protein PFL1_03584 [Pseudozyma flocculosa PF-1]EPQ28781.1 hypothetical protein PFL1_03584 [Pseudozyma flocculosa PF-1]SPO39434.1 uncharacterized protein PSFLO_04915 [Pseudozyma flocculosa]
MYISLKSSLVLLATAVLVTLPNQARAGDPTLYRYISRKQNIFGDCVVFHPFNVPNPLFNCRPESSLQGVTIHSGELACDDTTTTFQDFCKGCKAAGSVCTQQVT